MVYKSTLFIFGLIFSLNLLFTSPCFADDGYTIKGVVKNTEDKPINNVQVIITGTDQRDITNKNGGFLISNVKKGRYTLLFVSSLYREKKITVIVPLKSKLIVKLSPIVLDMGKIVVSEKKECTKIDKTETTFSKEIIEKLPTGGNPFRIVEKESGVVPVVISRENEGNVIERLPFPLSPLGTKEGPAIVPIEYSFFGGEPVWTRYFYDYIEVPRTTHLYGFPFPPSIVQNDLTRSVKFWRGTSPVNVDAYNSSVISVNPISEITENTVIITPSVTDISCLVAMQTGDRNGIILGLRKSLFEVTVWPFINMNISTGNQFSGYGDLIFRYLWGDDFDSVSVDLISFGDYFLSYGRTEGIPLYFKDTYFPFFWGSGLKWRKIFSDSFMNTIFASYGYSKALNERLKGEGESALKCIKNIDAMANELSVKDILLWLPTDFISLNLGLSGRYDIGNVSYHDLESEYEDDGINLQEMKGSSFVEGTLALGPVSLSSGFLLSIGRNTGLQYKISGNLDWRVNDKLRFSLKVGKGPLYISTLNRLSICLNETMLGIGDSKIYYSPQSFFSGVETSYNVNDIFKLLLFGYYAYYWDIKGINLLTVYYNSDSLADGIIVTDKGRSCGSGLTAELGDNLNNYLYVNYTVSRTEYHNDFLGWVRTNNDIRHVIKISGFSRFYGWIFGMNFMVFVDTPFTPIVVKAIDYSTGTPEPVYTFGKFNSGEDNVPRFRFDVDISKTVTVLGKKGKVFFNSTNLLVFLNPFLAGLKEEYKLKVGATTANYYMRNYIFDNSFSLIGSELGISIKL